MAEQLSFDLPAKPALGRTDFFISPTNAIAVAAIEGWCNWANRKLALTGETGSGKTHLTHVWAAESHARIIEATDLSGADIASLAEGPVAVEDVPEIGGNTAAESALFHLHNLVLAEGHHLLVTGRDAPVTWPIALPDLKSRLEATPHVTLAPPDDTLLAAVLIKLFADRQITPRPDVVPYLVERMERSFAAAATLVDALDRATLAEGRNLTRPVAARLLGQSGVL